MTLHNFAPNVTHQHSFQTQENYWWVCLLFLMTQSQQVFQGISEMTAVGRTALSEVAYVMYARGCLCVCVKTKCCTEVSPLGADEGLCSAGGWFLSRAEFHSIHSRTTEIIGVYTNLPQLLRAFIFQQEHAFSQVTRNPAEARTVQHECSHLATYASGLL